MTYLTKRPPLEAFLNRHALGSGQSTRLPCSFHTINLKVPAHARFRGRACTHDPEIRFVCTAMIDNF